MRNVVRTIIFVAIIAVIIVAFYFYLSKRNVSTEEKSTPEKVTMMDEVMNKDFVNDYPGTPRSVIKWFNKIITLFYDENTTTEQLGQLVDKALQLFDDELAALNPRDQYFMMLQSSVNDYRAHERRIAQTDVCDTGDVIYSKKDGRELSYVIASYFVTEGAGYTRIYQDYCLREDEDGHWKILAFELCDSQGDPVTGNTMVPIND